MLEQQYGNADWWVVHCKPRAEELARTHLERQGFECFLPRIRTEKRRANGWKTLIEPLFPRYLFIRAGGNDHKLASVRSTRGVHDLVRFGSRLAALANAEIGALERLLDGTTGIIVASPARYKVGDRIRLRDGALTGLEGVVAEVSGAKRVEILIEILGRETNMTVSSLSLTFA